MRKVLYCLAAIAITAGAGALNAQGIGAPESGLPSPTGATLSSRDADKTDSHDRPIGGIQLKLANGTGGNPGETDPVLPSPPPRPIEPPTGEELPPIEDIAPPPPEVGPPDFIGEPVDGKVAFLLDASGSMAGSGIATVRAEATSTISELTEDDLIDCVAYGSQFPASEAYSQFMWGALLPCTEGNKAAAIAWVNGPATNPGGGTPTYACLQKSCQVYPADLDKMFLLTDGEPNVSGSASQILLDFPGWWSKFNGTEFVAICINGSGPAQDFMMNLAALAAGTYIAA
jgi:hypothetical protein